MTLQLHTLAPMASIHNSANLNVGCDSCEISILRDLHLPTWNPVTTVETYRFVSDPVIPALVQVDLSAVHHHCMSYCIDQ